MSRCLVTGGAGFIGSHLVDYLLEEGNQVVALDNLSADNNDFYWNDSSVKIKADITNLRQLENAFQNVEYVFHLAAESRIGPAIENPTQCVEKNVLGTVNVLEAARRNKVKRVIFSSTSSIYGMNSSPNVETQSDQCLNPYSESKAAAEKFCRLYSEMYDLETVVLRYFNVFGDRSPTVGQYAPVIGIFERQAKVNDALTIVGDGTQKRDFVHVRDVARANYLAATEPIGTLKGPVFNVGSGKSYSVQEIANAISDNQVYLPPRRGEMKETRANIDKITNTLGWEPEVDVMDWIYGKRS